jgi:hypothetical protein
MTIIILIHEDILQLYVCYVLFITANIIARLDIIIDRGIKIDTRVLVIMIRWKVCWQNRNTFLSN